MAIPRGDCDCCGRLVDYLIELEEGYWVCRTCQGAAHRCPIDGDGIEVTRTEREG